MLEHKLPELVVMFLHDHVLHILLLSFFSVVKVSDSVDYSLSYGCAFHLGVLVGCFFHVEHECELGDTLFLSVFSCVKGGDVSFSEI